MLYFRYTTFLCGTFAGIITVYSTMPLDVVKTRMQSLNAVGGIISNTKTIIKDSGIRSLWKGSTPRLTRLIFSGGIVFTIYESVVSIYQSF